MEELSGVKTMFSISRAVWVTQVFPFLEMCVSFAVYTFKNINILNSSQCTCRNVWVCGEDN